MLNLLEPNMNYKNLKRELVELFPELSPYVLSSIYGETLRGQIKKVDVKEKRQETNFSLKKLYYENPKDKKRFKSYLIKLPNLLENICPCDLNSKNLGFYLGEINKALAVICRERVYNFQDMHALTLLVLWEQVGRFMMIEKESLINAIKLYSNVEQESFKFILNDLISCGCIINVGTEYGIRRVIRL